jgi:hypothetical protein
MTELWYRFVNCGPNVYLWRLPAVKRTPKGAWVQDPDGGQKFCLTSSRKKYAYPTLEEARESFVRRKTAQIKRCLALIGDANEALKLLPGKYVEFEKELVSIWERESGMVDEIQITGSVHTMTFVSTVASPSKETRKRKTASSYARASTSLRGDTEERTTRHSSPPG